MDPVEEQEEAAVRLEAEMAQVCGVINAAMGRLVDLVGEVVATKAWEGYAIMSPAHWVAGNAVSPRVEPGGWCPWPHGWGSCPRPKPGSKPAS